MAQYLHQKLAFDPKDHSGPGCRADNLACSTPNSNCIFRRTSQNRRPGRRVSYASPFGIDQRTAAFPTDDSLVRRAISLARSLFQAPLLGLRTRQRSGTIADTIPIRL